MKEKVHIIEWFHDYGDDILQFLIYYTGQGDMEDLTQEVFLKAWRNIESFTGHSSPKTWLFSIARNVAIDEMRKRKKEREKQTKVIDSIVLQNEKSVEDILSFNEKKRVI